MQEDHGDLVVLGWDQWRFGKMDLEIALVFVDEVRRI